MSEGHIILLGGKMTFDKNVNFLHISWRLGVVVVSLAGPAAPRERLGRTGHSAKRLSALSRFVSCVAFCGAARFAH